MSYEDDVVYGRRDLLTYEERRQNWTRLFAEAEDYRRVGEDLMRETNSLMGPMEHCRRVAEDLMQEILSLMQHMTHAADMNAKIRSFLSEKAGAMRRHAEALKLETEELVRTGKLAALEAERAQEA
jgi:hypothetical protein